MPYISQDQRSELDVFISDLADQITPSVRDGQLNYIIFTLINAIYPISYKDLNAAIGVLECAKQELYRRVIAPYEDTKIEENGDVYRGRSA